MLKCFTPKFQQNYSKLLGDKRRKTKRWMNTKFLQDQDLVSFPHKEKDLIGGVVNLNIPSLFPQKY
jgi:hypothetical protein